MRLWSDHTASQLPPGPPLEESALQFRSALKNPTNTQFHAQFLYFT